MPYGEVSDDVRYEMMATVAGLATPAGPDNFEISLLSAGTELNGSGYLRAFMAVGNPFAATWARSGTTATVTTPGNHNLVDGDTVSITDSSSTSAITNGDKTITVTGPTTFTFVCLNAGAGSGTLTMQPPAFWARDVDATTGDTTLVQQRDFSFPAASGANWLYDELRIHNEGAAGTWRYRFPTTQAATVLAGNTLTIPAGTLRIPDLSAAAVTG